MNLSVIALLVGLGLGGVALWQHEVASNLRTERDDFSAQLDAEKLRTQRLRADVLAATAKATSARRALKEALDAYPAYRDAPVPVPVRDSLCATLHCK